MFSQLWNSMFLIQNRLMCLQKFLTTSNCDHQTFVQLVKLREFIKRNDDIPTCMFNQMSLTMTIAIEDLVTEWTWILLPVAVLLSGLVDKPDVFP